MIFNYLQSNFTKRMRKQGSLNQEKQQDRRGSWNFRYWSNDTKYKQPCFHIFPKIKDNLFLFLLYFALQYCIGFAIHWHESATGVHEFPILNPPSTPNHPSGSSPCTSPKHPASCIEHRLAIHFLHDSIHVSMPFSQIIPPSPFPTESISLLYTSVSLLLSRIQGYHYHLSKFHIYALVYCIGVFLSGLLHSV